MIGLEPHELQILQEVLKTFPHITEAILFGSRALGTHRKASDVDLAIKGNIDIQTLSKLKYFLEEETLLPYFFDVLIYNDIKNKELKRHIDEIGEIIWKQ